MVLWHYSIMGMVNMPFEKNCPICRGKLVLSIPVLDKFWFWSEIGTLYYYSTLEWA